MATKSSRTTARTTNTDVTQQETDGSVADVNEQAADALRAAGADSTLDDEDARHVAGTQPHRGVPTRRR